MHESESKIEGGEQEKLDRLRDYLAQGYLLHGTKKRLAVLEPRQSSDDDPKRITGKAFAIYAEKEDVRIPILMALFDKADKSAGGWRSSYSQRGDGPLVVSGENCRFTAGYVYVLPPDTFEQEGTENDREYISRSAIRPVAVIEVTPEILKQFPEITYEMQ